HKPASTATGPASHQSLNTTSTTVAANRFRHHHAATIAPPSPMLSLPGYCSRFHLRSERADHSHRAAEVSPFCRVDLPCDVVRTCRHVRPRGVNPHDRLRSALLEKGVTPADLAAAVGVDPKSVERWIGGRTPYRRHRYAVAAHLGVDEAYLWPDALTPEQVAT